MKVTTSRLKWPVEGVFKISRGSRTIADAIIVEIAAGEFKGRGECVPYLRNKETLDSVEAQIRQTAKDLGNKLDRATLQTHLPAGAARNALDCALWDLAAKKSRSSVAALTGLRQKAEITTAFTLSVDTPEKMQQKAAEQANRPLLKLKLAGGEEDMERVAAVRSGSPDASIIVDANEAWSSDDYQRIVPTLSRLGVTMIEQPFPADSEQLLEDLDRPLPICADESCHTRKDLDRLMNRYDMINIKLDKTGGLTEAIALMREATERGMRVMIGCMLGSSLAMAPARLLADYAEIVDLDGPVLLAKDHPNPISFDGSKMGLPSPELWG